MLQLIFLGLIAAIAEILGGTFIILREKWPKKIQEYLLALSAGFLLALAFFELIPESISIMGSSAPIYIVIGFGLIHFVEHTIVGHLHFGEEVHSDVMLSPIASLSAFLGLAMHAFFDGFAISAGISYDYTLGMLIFIAILLHKFPEGLTIASIMIAAKQTRKTAFLASVSIGIATLIGIITAFYISQINPYTTGIALGITAGTSTYVGASDLIPEINRSENRITPLVVFGGMILFYVSKQFIHLILE